MFTSQQPFRHFKKQEITKHIVMFPGRLMGSTGLVSFIGLMVPMRLLGPMGPMALWAHGPYGPTGPCGGPMPQQRRLQRCCPCQPA